MLNVIIFNCYYMKMQIMSRLSKNQRPKLDSIKQTLQSKAYLHTQSIDQAQNIHEYYTINTDWVGEQQEKHQRLSLRDFFNNFSSCCQVKYDPSDFKPQEVKRELAALLETKKKDSQFVAKTQSREQSTAKSELQQDTRQNYFSQRAKQKIRKVNSLIAFDRQQSANTQQSTRKPGFIKQNKSLKKKQSSLHISKPADANKENIDLNDYPKVVTKCGNIAVQIDESKERIANIRRELNEIYQMRNRQGQYKLRLN